jgi:hypothetical protein
MTRTLSGLWQRIRILARDAVYFFRDWWNESENPNQDTFED